MLWYGYIYYVLFFVLLSIVFISSYSLSVNTSFNRLYLFSTFATLALALFVILSFTSLTLLYYLLDNFTYFQCLGTSIPGESLLITWKSSTFLLNQSFLAITPIDVYYFPFGYIFILITVLSILFCLSYNTNELSAFLLYCIIILSAGYSMFFTSSLLIFFFCIWNASNTVFFYSI